MPPKKDTSPRQDAIFFWILVVLILIVIGFIIYYAVRLHRKLNTQKEEFANNPTLRIIYLFSFTCPHCQQFEGTFDVKAKEFADTVDKNSVEIRKYEKANIPAELQDHVDGFPTVLVFKNDKFVNKSIGKMSGEELLKFLRSTI